MFRDLTFIISGFVDSTFIISRCHVDSILHFIPEQGYFWVKPRAVVFLVVNTVNAF